MSTKIVVLTKRKNERGLIISKLNRLLKTLFNYNNWIQFRDSMDVDSVRGIFADQVIFFVLDKASDEVIAHIEECYVGVDLGQLYYVY